MKTKMTAKFHSLKISLLLPGILLVLRLASAQCYPPPSGLVDWWPADGNAVDVTGTNNGTLVNAVSFVSGEVGQAFSFNGTNSYVAIGTNINPAQFSLLAWIRVDKLSDTSVIVSKIHNVAPYFGQNFEFRVAPDGHLILVIPNGSSSPSLISSDILATGIWYHVAATYNGTLGSLFINGVQDPNHYTGTYVQSAVSAAIGARPEAGGGSSSPNFFFNGSIDEAAIFSRALPPAEIAAIYGAGSAGMCRSPLIISQPQSQLGYWGQSASFSVGATPPPLNYQWQSNGVAISGATNQTLTLTNLQNSFAAGYTVVVSNPYGSVTSAPPANLTINPAGVSIALYPGVKIDGVVGLTYGIQSSTNLANTNGWIGVTNLTFTVPTEIWYDSIPASLSSKFYRVLQGPIPIP